MEAALMGRQQAGVMVKPELFPARFTKRTNRVWFEPVVVSLRRRKVSVSLKGVRSELTAKEKELPVKKRTTDPVKLFVGLPLDSVSDGNTVNHQRAIAAGLKALKLLGATGVELPIWWSVAQPKSSTEFDWSSYLAIAEMVRNAGLHLRVVLNLHGSKKIPSFTLPKWVKKIGEKDPDVFFTDRAGRRHAEYLSFAVDELLVLDGKSPLMVFEEFFTSFQAAFSDFIGNTVTDISIGLGPEGELRYPSFPPTSKCLPFTGIGEFQCYDKYMLANLKAHAEQSGNPYWGLSGPHDTPDYNQSPYSANFFKDSGGSWQTPYGNFFLSWYSDQLLSHGDRLLSTASKVFGDSPLTLSAKIPFLHWWQKTRSHPAELTAGYYNTDGRDGYDSVAAMFARNSCQMIVPGMDLADCNQLEGLRSSPESLTSQIVMACHRHGVKISGENSLLGGSGFGRIKENLLSVDSFTYQRMGADFFSPKHFPLFAEFVRGFAESEQDSDDLVRKGEKMSTSTVEMVKGNDREMQAV